jgi:hypothetical protein
MFSSRKTAAAAGKAMTGQKGIFLYLDENLTGDQLIGKGEILRI